MAGASGEDGDLKTVYLQEKIEKLRRDSALAEYKLSVNSEQLVNVAEIQLQLNQQASIVRDALGRLERKYGADALELVLEALEEVENLDLRNENEE